ncbi:hypothetical protein [Bacillus sp. JJ1764]|uniref:magnesium chelatase subunit ChlI family protein n=1 Tax=Bacillus sp. JJ1764 TaxID=3122964 RepID=UPI002FFE6F7C
MPDVDFLEVEMIYVRSLQDVIGHLEGKWSPSVPDFLRKDILFQNDCNNLDFQQVVGHAEAKHVLKIKHALSNRSQVKIILLARTISDLQANQQISDQSIIEAIQLNGGIK